MIPELFVSGIREDSQLSPSRVGTPALQTYSEAAPDRRETSTRQH